MNPLGFRKLSKEKIDSREKDPIAEWESTRSGQRGDNIQRCKQKIEEKRMEALKKVRYLNRKRQERFRIRQREKKKQRVDTDAD